MYCAILLMCNCAQASIYFHLICANNNDNDNDNDIFQGFTITIIIIILIIIIIIFLAYLHVQFISIKKDTILQAKQSYFQAQFFKKKKNRCHKVTIIFLFVIKKSCHNRILTKRSIWK